MVQDDRWPMLPFLIVRATQTLFGVILLGMTAYICSLGQVWWAGMGLFIALIILIWMAVNFILFFMGMLLPLAVVIVDAFCTLFLLISMAGTADSGWLALDCSYFYSGSLCPTIKGAFAMELLAMFLFIASLVFASITLYKHRADLLGRIHANGGVAPVTTSAELPAQSSQTQKPQEQYYQQPLQQMQNPQQPMQPTAYPTPVYNTQQQQQHMPQQPYTQGPAYDGFVSPPTSPPPAEMQHTGGYSTVSSNTPHPPAAGWPTAAAEMPASSHPRQAELPN
ncbi:hypothetical protein BZA05DRAFT_388323 [Tricharina praecox]|uniref:uncharacterized protein n=1 Tax=Tricharina praecox TaxID=43433 RepID=UPI00221E756B|nr:uncharacterized protein BZA05DRAFT_388323 [Tricharina praecox]KAI5856387.1 hypothetical protein BZA05DRAFT_388323 [Tricharina praecox]